MTIKIIILGAVIVAQMIILIRKSEKELGVWTMQWSELTPFEIILSAALAVIGIVYLVFMLSEDHETIGIDI